MLTGPSKLSLVGPIRSFRCKLDDRKPGAPIKCDVSIQRSSNETWFTENADTQAAITFVLIGAALLVPQSLAIIAAAGDG